MDCAFLTGGTGFIGASLARVLLSEGLSVKALARKNSDRRNLTGLGVEIIEGGLLDSDALERGVKNCRYVFHVAADYRLWAPKPDEMYRVNVDATESLLRIAARAGVERIVHCSSVAAVKILDNRVPSTESDEYLSPDEVIGDYKKSKFLSDRMARDLARKEGLPIIVVNPTAPIGPYDIKPTPTGRIVVDFLNGRMPSYIDTGMNIVHSEDVAIGHWLAATRGRIGERYILGGENLTFKAILDQLAAITGLKAPLFQTPYAVAYAYGALDTAISRLRGVEPRAPLDAVKMAKHYMWFSSTKAQQELGYRARPAQLALTDAVNWFTTHGYVTRLLHA